MAELKILVLFLISVNYKELIVQCEEVDYTYYSMEQDSSERSSTEMSSDNELTHVRTKNLSGNVILTTLELLTTTTPFDKPNNDGIFDRTTDGASTENKQDGTIAENSTESTSEVVTKAPTDGTVDLMDVSNGTSGTLPDRAATEKQIASEELIDERSGVFTFENTNSPFVGVEEADAYTTDFYGDFTTADAITTVSNEVKIISLLPEFETRKTENISGENIEDLSSFMNVDEELLNTVTDDVDKETGEDISVAVEDVSSILEPIEDNFVITKPKDIAITTTEDISAFTIEDMKEDINEDFSSIISNPATDDVNKETEENIRAVDSSILERIEDNFEIAKSKNIIITTTEDISPFTIKDMNEDISSMTSENKFEELGEISKTFIGETSTENFLVTTINEDRLKEEATKITEEITQYSKVFEEIMNKNRNTNFSNEYDYNMSIYDLEQPEDSFTPTTFDENLKEKIKIQNEEGMKENELNGILNENGKEQATDYKSISMPTTDSFIDSTTENNDVISEDNNLNYISSISTELNEEIMTTSDPINNSYFLEETDEFVITTSEKILKKVDEDGISTTEEIFTFTIPVSSDQEQILITEESKISSVTVKEIIDLIHTTTENEETNYQFTTPVSFDQEQTSVTDEITEESKISSVTAKEIIDFTNFEDETPATTENEEFLTPVSTDEEQVSVPDEITEESKINIVISKENTDFTTIDEDDTPPTTENEEINYTETVDSDKHNFNLTKAEMLTTEEMHNGMEPKISVNISGKITQMSVKIFSNESSFFVPPDAVSTFRPPNNVNITWSSSQIGINNSLELNIGKSIQLNIVKGNQMHVHKAALHSSENKLENVDANIITLDGGIRIRFSDADFLKTDRITKSKLEPETGSTAQGSNTLVGEIIGGCLGVLLVTIGAISLLVMRAKRKTRNFKPNQV